MERREYRELVERLLLQTQQTAEVKIQALTKELEEWKAAACQSPEVRVKDILDEVEALTGRRPKNLRRPVKKARRSR
jgi:hypothetical protein